MKSVIIFLANAAVAAATDRTANPVSKVLSLLGDLQSKVIADGDAEKKTFEAYVEFCKNGAKDKEFEITTAKSSIEDLTATISKAQADGAAATEKIDELAASVSTNDADLAAATEIRAKETDEFKVIEKELVDTIDTLVRATNILERNLKGAALLETKVDTADVSNVIKVLSEVVDAASISLRDKNKLTALLQASSGNGDSDEDLADALGAPAPDAYQSHSASIVDVLEDLRQKAETQLAELRKEEVSAQHTFALTKQSLEDQIKVDTDSLAATKSAKAESAQTKATAEGELGVTEKSLAEAEDTLKNMKSGCMRVADDHEASVKSREEELKAIGEAVAALQEMTGAASSAVYGASFLQRGQQVSSVGTQTSVGLRARAYLVNFEVVNLVRKVAREEKSAALAQLAGRISAAFRAGGASGEDPFEKVKAMISSVLERLEQEAGAEAQHKAYCDKEYAETKTKTDELKYDIRKLNTKIDKANSESARLKDEVAELQASLAATAKCQAEATSLRQKEQADYVKVKADLEQGLQGVRLAMKVLREYYAASEAALVQQRQPEELAVHEKSSGSGTSIIGLLEVVESDMGKSVASTEMEEETAAAEYERVSMDNRLSTAIQKKDVEYKTKKAASLDKAASELSSDLCSAQTELDAVLEYTTNIRAMCELKPETYEERAARREAEQD